MLRYKIAPKCLLSGPFGLPAVGGNPGVAGTVRSYNPVFTYPCQGCTGKYSWDDPLLHSFRSSHKTRIMAGWEP